MNKIGRKKYYSLSMLCFVIGFMFLILYFSYALKIYYLFIMLAFFPLLIMGINSYKRLLQNYQIKPKSLEGNTPFWL